MSLPQTFRACLKRFYTVIIISSVCVYSYAQAPYDVTIEHAKQAGMSTAKLHQISPAVKKLIDAQKLAGAVVVVANKGKVVYRGSFGWADVEGQQPMRMDTVVRIYSMTKPITSIAVLMLHERGLLDIDAPVSAYIPEFENLKVYSGENDNKDLILQDMQRQVTITDLLRHTSGLTYACLDQSPVGEMYAEKGIANAKDLRGLIAKLKGIPLVSQPGEKFTYGVSTDVLGFLIEKVSGMPLKDFLQKEIFTPLRMTETGFRVPESANARFAKVYDWEGEGIVASSDPRIVGDFHALPTMFSGGGGLISTADDYLNFCLMLLNKGKFDGTRIVAGKTIREMTKNQLPESAYPISLLGKQDGVGFGLGVSVVTEITDFCNTARVGEFGWDGIASTHFWISPKDDLIVIALSQNWPFSHQLRDVLRPIVYGALSPE